MDFKDKKAIYIQITHLASNRIADGEWLVGERIPSVRELASQLEVNPNTIMRSYELLTEQGIIFNKRGMGFFVCDEALNIIKEHRKQELMNVGLVEIAQEMIRLDVSIEEVTSKLNSMLNSVK